MSEVLEELERVEDKEELYVTRRFGIDYNKLREHAKLLKKKESNLDFKEAQLLRRQRWIEMKERELGKRIEEACSSYDSVPTWAKIDEYSYNTWYWGSMGGIF